MTRYDIVVGLLWPKRSPSYGGGFLSYAVSSPLYISLTRCTFLSYMASQISILRQHFSSTLADLSPTLADFSSTRWRISLLRWRISLLRWRISLLRWRISLLRWRISPLRAGGSLSYAGGSLSYAGGFLSYALADFSPTLYIYLHTLPISHLCADRFRSYANQISVSASIYFVEQLNSTEAKYDGGKGICQHRRSVLFGHIT